MPRTCTICSHPERGAIDVAVAAGTSYRHIASQFGVGYKSVERHASDHISEEIKQSQDAREEAQALNVIGQLREINAITLEILQKARTDKKQQGLALQAIDRVHKQIELQAKLLGDIDTPQINIMVSPEWILIRTTIIRALAPFPDARIVVAQALSQMSNNRDRLN